MNLPEFIRIADSAHVFETDIDPLCTLPSHNFAPDASLYARVVETTAPAFDPITQAVSRDGVELVDGVWQYKWSVTSLSADQVAANQAAAVAATIASFDAALTNHLDTTAQTKRYDNRTTCALRAGYAGPFQAEGQAFASWMDACNWQAYQILTGVQSGDLTMPTVEEFIADLPELVWPT